jgi:hypothetical protein
MLEDASRALHGILAPSGGEHGSPGRVAVEAMGDAAALFSRECRIVERPGSNVIVIQKNAMQEERSYSWISRGKQYW